MLTIFCFVVEYAHIIPVRVTSSASRKLSLSIDGSNWCIAFFIEIVELNDRINIYTLDNSLNSINSFHDNKLLPTT